MSTQVQTSVEPAADAAPARPPGNTLGRNTALTLFTPIRRRYSLLVRFSLWASRYLPTVQRHILQFEFIHFVRWTLVRDLPHSDREQRTRLNYPYLFFESNFDGPWRNYIDAFAYIIPWDIRYLWGRGIQFPGPPPAEPLKAWIARNSMEGGDFYAAYPRASTKMVIGALAVREGLERLVASAGSMSPEEFKAAYERFLSEQQVHL